MPKGKGGGARAALLLAALLSACAPAAKPPPAAPAPETLPEPAPVLDGHGRLLVEAMEYPWSAIGRLNAGGRNHCTGRLVGPRLVLASARCLYNGTEGRWWAPAELHFVAGYQRDAVLIHAAVADYEVAPAFDPAAGASLANVTANWALVVLQAPIGRDAGWLALQPYDDTARRRVARGEGLPLQAGYRRGWAHAMTVKLGCVDGWTAPAAGARDPCAGAPRNPELPSFLFLGGELRALANPDLLREARAAGIAARRDGAAWGSGRPPAGGPAAARPVATVSLLLHRLGYLADPAAAPGALRAAIRRFEARAGVPATGMPSVALLGHVMAAARRAFAAAPPPRISRRPDAGRLVRLER